MNALHKFTINNIARKLNKINCKISLSHQIPFPKAELLSKYSFNKRFVHLYPTGAIQGGYVRIIASLVDFSFIRSLVADAYSIFGPDCYDPVTLFLLDLFRYIDDYPDNMNAFMTIVRDKDRGRVYREYAGIMKDIPCNGTFSNFRTRIGTQRYNEIFHVLVGIFHELEMITFKILAHDGTLYPSWARYKGCTPAFAGAGSTFVRNVPTSPSPT